MKGKWPNRATLDEDGGLATVHCYEGRYAATGASTDLAAQGVARSAPRSGARADKRAGSG